MRMRFFLSACLALAGLAGCTPPPEPRSPPVPAAYYGRLAIAAAALAAPHPPRNLQEELDMGNRLDAISFDENKDGALDFDEWIESEFSAFLLYNASHDGKLKYEEFRRYYANLSGGELDEGGERETRKRFNDMDKGRKGYLEVDDFHDLAFSSFALNDVNKDGRVTEAEISEVANRHDTGHSFP